MSFLDEALVSLILGSNAINNVISGRIYPIKAPDNPVMPMITYQRISNLRESLITREQPKLTETIMQIDVWVQVKANENSLAILRTLSKNIRELLDSYSGVVLGVDIGAILGENEYDQPWDDESKIYGVTHRFRIFHRE